MSINRKEIPSSLISLIESIPNGDCLLAPPAGYHSTLEFSKADKAKRSVRAWGTILKKQFDEGKIDRVKVKSGQYPNFYYGKPTAKVHR